MSKQFGDGQPARYAGDGIPVAGNFPFMKMVRGPTVTVTRPNNATAYSGAVLQVYGDAADARVLIVAPPLPADAVSPGYQQLAILPVQSQIPTATAFVVFFYMFSGGLPATVLGDQATLALSDPDHLRLLQFPNSVQSASFPSGAGGVGPLNQSAGIAGRRHGLLVKLPNGTSLSNIIPASTFGLYLATQTAYTPLNLETIQLITWWTYCARSALT